MVRPGSQQWKVVMLEWHLTKTWLKVTIPGSSGWVNLEYLQDCLWSSEPIERPRLPDSLATAETSRLPIRSLECVTAPILNGLQVT